MAAIHILGAGTPTPTRFGSAYVVETGDDFVMFDCGPAATHKLVYTGFCLPRSVPGGDRAWA